jgi:hypothetical protein
LLRLRLRCVRSCTSAVWTMSAACGLWCLASAVIWPGRAVCMACALPGTTVHLASWARTLPARRAAGRRPSLRVGTTASISRRSPVSRVPSPALGRIGACPSRPPMWLFVLRPLLAPLSSLVRQSLLRRLCRLPSCRCAPDRRSSVRQPGWARVMCASSSRTLVELLLAQQAPPSSGPLFLLLRAAARLARRHGLLLIFLPPPGSALAAPGLPRLG